MCLNTYLKIHMLNCIENTVFLFTIADNRDWWISEIGVLLK